MSAGKQLKYEVVRSRRKTADIVLERDGSLVVRAPDWADDDKVREIVASKESWIYRALAEWRDLNATRLVREYVNGEGFLYLGRSYRLLLVQEQEQPLLLKRGRFLLRRELVDASDPAAAQDAFRDYYIERGLERIAPRVEHYAPRVGVEYSGVDVRELGRRWASCSPKGRLAFHWKCMMAPLSIIDYIVVHELCHRHHRDHTDGFWNEVDKVQPGYREKKDWLKMHGAGLSV